jgi:hypothetical protein
MFVCQGRVAEYLTESLERCAESGMNGSSLEAVREWDPGNRSAVVAPLCLVRRRDSPWKLSLVRAVMMKPMFLAAVLDVPLQEDQKRACRGSVRHSAYA